jgi:opacity protein-like surface antigen
MRSLMAWCVMAAGALLLVSGNASAQALAPAPAEGKGYVEAFAQSAFSNVTSQSYGGEVGVTIRSHLQVFGEFGIIRNVATASLGTSASVIAGALTQLQPAAVDYTVKEPVTFGAGGVRYLIPTMTKLQPYLQAGAGIAKVKNDVVFKLGGTEAPASVLAQYVTIGTDLSGETTKPMITFGGGVVWPVWQQLVVDLQFRFGRILLEDEAVNVGRIGLGIGVRF